MAAFKGSGSKKNVFQLDGWQNVVNGFNTTSRDGNQSVGFVSENILDEETCRALYESEGIAKRIVDIRVKHMFREGFTVSNDTDGLISTYIRKSGLYSACREAQIWGDVFGQGVLVLGINDGNIDMSEPLNEDNMKSLDFFTVYDKTRITIDGFEEDPASEFYMKPSMYSITPVNGASFSVHRSRVIEFMGELATQDTYIANGYSHLSFYQAIKRKIEQMVSTYDSAKKIVHDLYMWVYKFEGLASFIAQDAESGGKFVTDRANQLDMTRNFLNMMLIDTQEDMDKKTGSVAGVAEIMSATKEMVLMAGGVPESLMGTAPKGLSNSDASGEKFFYDDMADRQESNLYPKFVRLITIIMKLKDGVTGGKEIKDWDIKFNPIERESQKQIVENRKAQAETDEIYMNRGLSVDDVLESRYGGNEYSYETKYTGTVDIDPDEADKIVNE